MDILKWNGYPKNVVKFLINNLKRKYSGSLVRNRKLVDADNLPKVWSRIPYLGRKGEFLIKSSISKIQRYLKLPVKFIIYNSKKISYFTSNKDKIPDTSRSVIYQITFS